MSLLVNQSHVNENTTLWQPNGSGSDVTVIAADQSAVVYLTAGTPSYYKLFTVECPRKAGVYVLTLTADIQAGSADPKTISLEIRDTNTNSYFRPYPSLTTNTAVTQQLSASWTLNTGNDPATPVKLEVFAGTSSIAGGAPGVSAAFVLTYFPTA